MSESTKSNWDNATEIAENIPPREIIAALLQQIAKMRKPRESSIPLWSFVGMATNHGSTVSAAICCLYGVNSDTGALTSSE